MQFLLSTIAPGRFPEGSDAVFHWAVLPRVREPNSAFSPEEDHLRLFSRMTLQMASPTVLCLALMSCHIRDVVEAASFLIRNADDLALVATAGDLRHLLISAWQLVANFNAERSPRSQGLAGSPSHCLTAAEPNTTVLHQSCLGSACPVSKPTAS